MGKVEAATLRSGRPSAVTGSCSARRARIPAIIILLTYPSAASVLQEEGIGDPMHDDQKICPDCGDGVSRRGFMKTTAAAAAAAALSKAPVWASTWREEKPEAIARRLFESLKPEQKELVALPWEDKRRLQVSNNWDIVPQTIGKFYSGDQQQMIRDIFKGIVREDGAGRFSKQMKDDYGGFERYTVAMFGDLSTSK